MCLLVVAVILGTMARLKQDNLLALMNTAGTVLSILISILLPEHPRTPEPLATREKKVHFN